MNIWAVIVGMFRQILELAVACAELPLSHRGLQVIFLMTAIFLTVTRAGWLRPPLSPDISSIHIPLGIWKSETYSPEEILRGPRRITLDSAGALLLTLIASGTLVVLWRPQRFGTVAGLLLCGAICVNSAAAFNHPALIELMDLELAQWQQIDKFVPPSSPDQGLADPFVLPSSEDKLLVDPKKGRIAPTRAPAEYEQRGDLGRGWAYLLYGLWLVLWAVVGILLGCRGSLRQRLANLSRWVLLGMSLTGVVCFRRLSAEYHWEQAKLLEAQCDYSASPPSPEGSHFPIPRIRPPGKDLAARWKTGLSRGTFHASGALLPSLSGRSRQGAATDDRSPGGSAMSHAWTAV